MIARPRAALNVLDHDDRVVNHNADRASSPRLEIARDTPPSTRDGGDHGADHCHYVFLACRVWNGIFAARDRRRQTGPGDDISAQRPEIGDHHAREIAAKTAFLQASYQLRVSKDWVVGEPGLR